MTLTFLHRYTDLLFDEYGVTFDLDKLSFGTDDSAFTIRSAK
jgi:hypothetical protein